MSAAFYQSAGGGATWNTLMIGLAAAALSDFTRAPTRFDLGLSHPAGHSAVLYAGFDWFNSAISPNPGAHRGARVFKSTDGGAHWTVTSFGTGIDSVLGYCGTQCSYDNVIE